ncbi:MAG: hypothetical protein ACRD6X_22535 [Pyrinomonadaceae bacterium]
MSVTLTISDETFQRLKFAADAKGKKDVGEFLEDWQNDEETISDEELAEREQLVSKIDAFRNQMFAKYGQMHDSTEYIREDRQR